MLYFWKQRWKMFAKISRSQCCFSPDVNIWFDEEYKETVLVFYMNNMKLSKHWKELCKL